MIIKTTVEIIQMKKTAVRLRINNNYFNPLIPRDALKHHFTFLKNTLNFPATKFMNENFHKTSLPIYGNFL